MNMAAVLDFIDTIDDSDDVNRMCKALERAVTRIETRREQTVRLDDMVTITGVTPHYLNGLTGEVIYIDGKDAYIALTRESTGALRFAPDNDRYKVGADERYVVPMVPLSCCVRAGESTAADGATTALVIKDIEHVETPRRRLSVV